MISMARERGDKPARSRVPQPRGAIRGRGDDARTVWAEDGETLSICD